MGIDPSPNRADPAQLTEGDVESWRLWFEQVKAGTRTYRFKGNPQNYGFAGPVDRERNPALAATAAPSGHDQKEGEESQAVTDAPTSNKGPIAATIAAVLLCLYGLWMAFRNRRRATA